MNSSEEQTEPLVSRIIKLAEGNPDIKLLWLYGSQGDGTDREGSDYDLAIAFETRLKNPMEQRLRPELLTLDWQHNLELPDHVLSIVDINLAPLPLALNIIGDNTKLLLNNDELRYIRELNRIWGLWSDSQWQDNHISALEQERQ
jgi:predicted nucleotidyltransferase